MFSSREKNISHALDIVLGIAVGAVCGLAVYGFLCLLDFLNGLFFGGGKQVLGFMKQYYVLVLPAVGGLLVWPLVYYGAKEARGHGVPEVMADQILKGGYVPTRVVLVKTLAAAVCMGSGGSAGRVGPIIHICSGIGSAVGQVFKLPPHVMRALVACGTAAGVSANFNAPIGGVMFALEVILGEFATTHLMMVVVSAVTASVVSRNLFGGVPPIAVPQFTMLSSTELLLYAVLGAATGLFSYIYIKTFYRVEDLFKNLAGVPPFLKPALGGLIVGGIGLFFPQVFGVGYDVIEMTLAGEYVLGLMAVLLVLKLLATSITLGSGGSGGVFAPSLYLGSMLGGALGLLFQQLFPQLVVSPMAFALAGMAGMLAGGSFAPITGIILLFEMSNDYKMILPLMITSIISFVITTTLTDHSIYTTKLYRKGLDLEQMRRPDVLTNTLVKEVMTVQPETIAANAAVFNVWNELQESPHQGFAVVDADGKVLGMITRKELYRAIKEGRQRLKVADLINKRLIYVKQEQPLINAVALMSRHRIGRLPVLNKSGYLVGIISRSDVLKAYTVSPEQRENLPDKSA